MKKVYLLAFFLSILGFNTVAAELPLSPYQGVDSDQSTDDPDEGDPCVAVTCLYGKLSGNAQSSCDPAVKAFKSIKATKKHGIFDPVKTLKKRTKFINGCASAPGEYKDMVLKAFGKMKNI